MRKLIMLAVCISVLTLSACTGTRGKIGNQRVCTNDYLLGIISISEMVSPCGKQLIKSDSFSVRLTI